MGKIMITGALGNVGGYAAEFALKFNQEVTVADINVQALKAKYGEDAKAAYPVTGPEAIDYWRVAEILTKHLGRKITYADPSPSLAKQYWIEVRGLDQEYSKVMCMLYMITRMGNAKAVTGVFEEIMGKKPQSFEQFVVKNLDSWR